MTSIFLLGPKSISKLDAFSGKPKKIISKTFGHAFIHIKSVMHQNKVKLLVMDARHRIHTFSDTGVSNRLSPPV